MAEKIAANPIRRIVWWGEEQLDTFHQSQAPTVKFIRFFVWEIPKWNITSLKLFVQSDIVKILAVPIVAAIITTATTINERREREQVETLDEYLNQIDTLTFEHGLLTEEPSPGAVVLARGRTIAALRKLNSKRQEELIAFIRASGFHKGEDDIISGEDVISFEKANLQKLNLKGVELHGFNFKEANLRGANLEEADFGNANLERVNLEDANLVRANLKNANLEGASLRKTNLVGADLRFSNLAYTDLQGANLKRADLKNANLKGANLYFVNLTGVNLEVINLDEVYICNTTMPDGEVRNDNCPKAR